MTAKRYVRIVDHLEKEVQIFDTINEKKIFNIFFNELDSAICLNGALTDVVDLLNELHEEVQSQSIVIKGYQDRNEILNQQIYDKNKILLTEIEINENLHDENNRIKQTIQDMMENERTELGKSVLKQLYEAIQ